MTGPDLFDAFGVDHIQCGAQPIKMMGRGRAAMILKEFLRMGARRPIPIPADTGQSARAASARSLKKTKDMPGGTINPF